MAKKSKTFGVNNYHERTRKKRPGRHSKSPNKSRKRIHKSKYRGQGRAWQIISLSYILCNKGEINNDRL